jgi:hypothetical protein
MSQENVEIHVAGERGDRGAVLRAFAAGGVESLLAFVSADVAWYPFPEWVEESECSGVPIRQPLGIVFSDFRDGQIGEARNFLTWQQTLAAVGLRE